MAWREFRKHRNSWWRKSKDFWQHSRR